MATHEINASIRDTVREYTRTVKQSFTATGNARDIRTLEIGTSEETITILSDITAGNGPGYALLENLDDTNFIDLGFATTDYKIRLHAGAVALIPLAPSVTALYLKADNAACDLDIEIHER